MGKTSIQPLINLEDVNVNIDWTLNEIPPYKYAADPTAWVNDDVTLA